MAYVERRSRDRWRARYRGPDGRERSKTFARRIDAERFLAAMEHSKSIGAFVDPALGRVRLADFGAHVAPRRWADGQTQDARFV